MRVGGEGDSKDEDDAQCYAPLCSSIVLLWLLLSCFSCPSTFTVLLVMGRMVQLVPALPTTHSQAQTPLARLFNHHAHHH